MDILQLFLALVTQYTVTSTSFRDAMQRYWKELHKYFSCFRTAMTIEPLSPSVVQRLICTQTAVEVLFRDAIAYVTVYTTGHNGPQGT